MDNSQREHEAADYDRWFREQVQIGLDQAEAGLLIPGDEVEAEFAERRAASLRRAQYPTRSNGPSVSS